ncbi:MAG TPA: calcium/sodium antiporter [Polyangiaceae bacterium]|nr:calcium/sodium antiporter [Polyangiaceae bacterium]
MAIDFGLLLLGGLLLYFGAEWLVRGAAGIASSLGVRPLVIGLMVVAYGTSAPELAVGVRAALSGKSDLAFGNAIGSNIANLGLILGATALVAPPAVDPSLIRREVPVLVASTLLVPLAMLDGRLAPWEGLCLVALALVYTVHAVRSARAVAAAPADSPQAAVAATAEAEAVGSADRPAGRAALGTLAALGLALLVGGGDLFVRGATGLARALGLSDRLIGLTVVAVGTSLPELAASLVAALRGHGAIAVGNVVGSNIFNLLLILGAAGAVRGVDVDPRSARLDLLALLGFTLFAAVALRGDRRISRPEGALLLAGYVGFVLALVAS